MCSYLDKVEVTIILPCTGILHERLHIYDFRDGLVCAILSVVLLYL